MLNLQATPVGPPLPYHRLTGRHRPDRCGRHPPTLGKHDRHLAHTGSSYAFNGFFILLKFLMVLILFFLNF
jgi:hypothetical protein